MSQIKVGDLVVVAKTGQCPVAGAKSLGMVFRVKEVFRAKLACRWCGNSHSRATQVWAAKEDGWNIPLWRLKRIPPLSELESEKNKEELTA